MRLNVAHVSKQINCGLLKIQICASLVHIHSDIILVGKMWAIMVVMGIETPWPLTGPSSKHKRSWFGLVDCQGMCCCSRVEVSSPVLNDLNILDFGSWHFEETWRSESVVKIFIQLVSQDAWFFDDVLIVQLKFRNLSVPPESEFTEYTWNNEDIVPPGIYSPNLPSQRVLRIRSKRVDRPWVNKGACPLCHIRIYFGLGLRFFVDHDGSVIILPSDSPIHLVAREEAQVHPLIPSALDIWPLNPRPVFIVTNWEKDFVVEKVADTKSVCIYSCLISNVVSILLKPSNHRVLRAPKHVTSPMSPRHHRPVVRCFVGSTDIWVSIHVAVCWSPSVVVVNLPDRIRCLEEQVSFCSLDVSDHEIDMACLWLVESNFEGPITTCTVCMSTGLGCVWYFSMIFRIRKLWASMLLRVVSSPRSFAIVPDYSRKVNSWNLIIRYVPAAWNTPIATICIHGILLIHARRLILWEFYRRQYSINMTRPIAIVVSNSEDVESIIFGICHDFEIYCLSRQ